MKISGVMKSAAVLLLVSAVATSAFAGPQNNQGQVTQSKGERYAYVWVTGSKIPQRVKISPVGTLTFNSLTVWDRRQINQVGPGRFTAEGVLRLDPAVTVRMGRAGGGF